MPDAPTRELTSGELDAYDRDGVICVRGLLPQAWIERMAAAVDRVAGSLFPQILLAPYRGR